MAVLLSAQDALSFTPYWKRWPVSFLPVYMSARVLRSAVGRRAARIFKFVAADHDARNAKVGLSNVVYTAKVFLCAIVKDIH